MDKVKQKYTIAINLLILWVRLNKNTQLLQRRPWALINDFFKKKKLMNVFTKIKLQKKRRAYIIEIYSNKHAWANKIIGIYIKYINKSSIKQLINDE